MVLALWILTSVGHAAEVAGGERTMALGQSPASFAALAPGRGVRSELPVTFVAGAAGPRPRGVCAFETGRNRDNSVRLHLAALKSPFAQHGFFDKTISIAPGRYPLRPGYRDESVEDSTNRTIVTYDGTHLRVREERGGDRPGVTTYQISVDPALNHMTSVTAETFEGTKTVPAARLAAVGCDPTVG